MKKKVVNIKSVFVGLNPKLLAGVDSELLMDITKAARELAYDSVKRHLDKIQLSSEIVGYYILDRYGSSDFPDEEYERVKRLWKSEIEAAMECGDLGFETDDEDYIKHIANIATATSFYLREAFDELETEVNDNVDGLSIVIHYFIDESIVKHFKGLVETIYKDDNDCYMKWPLSRLITLIYSTLLEVHGLYNKETKLNMTYGIAKIHGIEEDVDKTPLVTTFEDRFDEFEEDIPAGTILN